MYILSGDMTIADSLPEIKQRDKKPKNKRNPSESDSKMVEETNISLLKQPEVSVVNGSRSRGKLIDGSPVLQDLDIEEAVESCTNCTHHE